MDPYSEIVTIVGNGPTMGGGGRGQIAAVEFLGQYFEAKGTSRQAALESLVAKLRTAAQEAGQPVEQPKVAKPRVAIVSGGDEEPLPREADAKGHRACDMSCLFAHIDQCVCQCEGANHQAGWLLFQSLEVGSDVSLAQMEQDERFGGPKRKKGGRECLCGCGEMTSGGRFKQGHDRKLHARLFEQIDADEFFRTEDGVGLVQTPAGRKAIAAARKATKG